MLFCNCQCQEQVPRLVSVQRHMPTASSALAVGSTVWPKDKPCFCSSSPLSPGPCAPHLLERVKRAKTAHALQF